VLPTKQVHPGPVRHFGVAFFLEALRAAKPISIFANSPQAFYNVRAQHGDLFFITLVGSTYFCFKKPYP